MSAILFVSHDIIFVKKPQIKDILLVHNDCDIVAYAVLSAEIHFDTAWFNPGGRCNRRGHIVEVQE